MLSIRKPTSDQQWNHTSCEANGVYGPAYSLSTHATPIVELELHFYRATRMHSADYAVARCLSICLSVRLSHAGIESKRL